MATVMLVGVDLFVRSKLEAALAGNTVFSGEGALPPDVVIADIGRGDPVEIVERFPGVRLIGFTNHTNTEALRAAHAAGFDRVIVKSALFARVGELIAAVVPPVK